MSEVSIANVGDKELRLGAEIAVRHGWTTDDDNKAILQKAENPAAGRLVWVPWGCGSKCVPKVDHGEDTHGGRC